MKKNNHTKRASLSYDELLQQNQVLRRELDEYRAEEISIWNVLAETGLNFQIYSASIKAAVSSLLDNDIFWDSGNQHEFLETIDSSANQVSEITVLLTLAFRAQANSLILSSEAHLPQEILSASQAMAIKKIPNIRLDVSFPPDGRPVLVDYEYMTKALLMLYEVLFAQSPTEPIRVVANETVGTWFLDFFGLNPSVIKIIAEMHNCKTQPKTNEVLSAEYILRLHIVCEILHLQQVSIDVVDEPGQASVLRLSISGIATTK